MRQSLIAASKLRERITRRSLASSSSSSAAKNGIVRRAKSSLAIQLDYYMSPQFGGIAAALVTGLYDDLDISFLPTCPVGKEQERVRLFQDANPGATCLGSVEQNIFIPTLYASPELKVKAVAAMFRRSPLCVASLPDGDTDTATVGAHEDTVDLLLRIFPNSKVVASPRATKISDLTAGTVDGIQAYTTTEVPTLRRQLGREPDVVELEGLHGTKLGYSQVLFGSEESLEGDRRDITDSFLAATFKGWDTVIRDPEEGIKIVREAQKMLGLDDESNDHWHESMEYQLEMLQLCNDYVKETFEGDRLGVINTRRWNDATKWILDDVKTEKNFGLEPTLWQPPKNLLAGNELARTFIDEAKQSATAFQSKYGRKPSLAVITVGKLDRYAHAERRLQLYSNSSNSWFSKTKTGAANGFDVEEINLDEGTTTDALLSKIYSLKDVDGIQLMWPLPSHIDEASVYNAISVEKDVDGIHFVGQQEIKNVDAFPPVTPAATLALIKQYNIKLENKNVLVVGRSLIVGSPTARMLRNEGAIVTVAHSQVTADKLEKLVRNAEVVVTCAGLPGLLKAKWVEDAIVINVGTTFVDEADNLHPDFEGDLTRHASRFSPVPGGVGPLSAPILFQNVAQAAWDQMKGKGTVVQTWNRRPAALFKSYHFGTYTEAIDFAKKVDEMSTIMDHHANMKIVHKCVDGVDMELEFYTFEAGKLTDKDFEAAQAIDTLAGGGDIKMEDYTYNLDPKSIATHPAHPRGSSKLLRVDEKGSLSFYDTFGESFPSLAKGAHIVLNESKVLDARLFVNSIQGADQTEMMILDIGDIDINLPCKEIELNVMLRTQNVNVGDIFELIGGGNVEVVGIKGEWQEDEDSNGNGTECNVTILSDDSLKFLLEQFGTVPIPPYFHREAEESDKVAYNTVYAAGDGGSVAAPTAGLHFTNSVLAKIGPENLSHLCLHVGAGTFKPVVSEDARDHKMHQESFSVSVGETRRIISALEGDAKKPLMVVGTTSCRTLESLFWCGVKKIRGYETDPNNLVLGQFEWIPLNVGEGVSRAASLQSLVEGLPDNAVLSGKTSLMITPNSYEFKVVDHLMTNFHAPDSTLMLLVSAFLGGGDKVKFVYETAQRKGYRFLSYGDVCLLSRPGAPPLHGTYQKNIEN